LYAPAGVDSKIISEINTVVNSALSNPKYKEKFSSSEIVGPGGTMAELYITQDRALKLLRNVSKNIE